MTLSCKETGNGTLYSQEDGQYKKLADISEIEVNFAEPDPNEKVVDAFRRFREAVEATTITADRFSERLMSFFKMVNKSYCNNWRKMHGLPMWRRANLKKVKKK